MTPVFADAYAADGRRAEAPGDFRDGPQRRLVGAVILRDVQRMLFDKVEAFAKLEGGADGLAVIFRNAHEAVDAIVAFGILDAAAAYDGGVDGSGRGENFDAVDVELAANVGRAVGVDAEDEIAGNGGERRGEFGGVFDVAGGELGGGEL